MTLAQKIREVRKARGMSQKELAEALGVPTIKISNWELEKAEIRARDMELISKILRVPLNYLLVENGTPFIYTDDEITLLDVYRSLDEIGRDVVINAALHQKERCEKNLLNNTDKKI